MYIKLKCGHKLSFEELTIYHNKFKHGNKICYESLSCGVCNSLSIPPPIEFKNCVQKLSENKTLTLCKNKRCKIITECVDENGVCERCLKIGVVKSLC